MPPLVVAGVVRVTLNATLNGFAIATIMDVDVDRDFGLDLDSAVGAAVAQDVSDAWQDHIVAELTDHYVFTGVDWVILESEDSPTGSLSPDSGKPGAGAVGSDVMSPQVSYLVHKNLEGGSRSTRAGRLYLPGVFESTVDDAGLVNTDTREQYDDSFEDFKDGVNGFISGESARTQNLCVVHDPAVGGTSSTHISTFSMDAMVATQKRRLHR